MTPRSPKTFTIFLKRAYDEPTPQDGYRVLVDRVWPRGRSKEALQLAEWARELAPSAELRKWFGHNPKRWEIFRTRYQAELGAPEQQKRMQLILQAVGNQPLTLVYGAKDEQHNQAIVLRDFLLQIASSHSS